MTDGVHFLDARGPDGTRLYAIGDVHGCIDQLEAIFGLIDAEIARDGVEDWRIILLGDYCDRGPDVRGVLDLIMSRQAADPRVIALTPAAQAAFDQAGTVVVEAVDALDPKTAAATMMQNPDLVMFTDGRKLTDLLDPEERVRVAEELEERGMPLVAIQHMKPWVVSSALALPACEMARKQSGAPFLDARLARDAKAAGKTLLGLETIVSQLEAMNSLPMEVHVDGLVATLALEDRLDDMIETMIVLYKREEVGMVWPLLESVTPQQPGSNESYAAFEKVMVTARNHGMVSNARPVLEKGNAFIAVGALHLPGEEGVVELLRKAGYAVTRAE